MEELQKSNHLHVVLIGPTGHGKSRLGNKILGRESFASFTGYESITKLGSIVHALVKSDEIEIESPISLVDTMGIGDTDEDWETQKINIAEAFNLSPNGFDIILLVVEKGRFTENLMRAMEYLFDQLLGNQAYPYCYVVITKAKHLRREDQLAELKKNRQKGLIQLMLNKIGEEKIIFLEMGDEETDKDESEFESRDKKLMKESIQIIRNVLLKHPKRERYLTEVMKKVREDYALFIKELDELRRLEKEKEEAKEREIVEKYEREMSKVKEQIKEVNRREEKYREEMKKRDNEINQVKAELSEIKSKILPPVRNSCIIL